MYKYLSKFSLLSILAFTCFSLTNAQTIILTIDQSYVVGKSIAGQSVSAQLKRLQENAGKELKAEVSSVTKDIKTFNDQKKLLSEADLQKRGIAINKRRQNLPVLREIKQRELVASEQKALKVITDAMRPILNDIVKKRKATIVLDKSVVVYNAPSTDITAEVLSKLNKKITQVKVKKTDLRAEIAKAQATARKK